MIDYTWEVLLSVIVVIMGADGELQDVKLKIIDGPVYTKCLDNSGCTRFSDNTIFINYHDITRTDDCGRSVFYHELAHVKYRNSDIHNECKLNVKVVHWRSTA